MGYYYLVTRCILFYIGSLLNLPGIRVYKFIGYLGTFIFCTTFFSKCVLWPIVGHQISFVGQIHSTDVSQVPETALKNEMEK